jgi:hypothetical protein
MLSDRHDGCRRKTALNDNGRLSGAWHGPSSADVGIMAVARAGGRSIDLTYVADGVLIISTPLAEGRLARFLPSGRPRELRTVRVKRHA